MDITKLSKKAEHSSFYRWLLSFGLNQMVPFNKPHGFSIDAISGNSLTIKLPYKKRNLNHVKGLHACAMATLAEVCSGFLLLSRIDPKEYRIILSRLEMDYYYQGKSAAYATFKLPDKTLKEHVLTPLSKAEKISFPCQVEIHDSEQNHLAKGIAHWQIKNWKSVKLKM